MDNLDRTPIELLSYRVTLLEEQIKIANSKLEKLLVTIETSKTAGRWLIGIAAACGAFVTWLIHTFGHLLTPGVVK